MLWTSGDIFYNRSLGLINMKYKKMIIEIWFIETINETLYHQYFGYNTYIQVKIVDTNIKKQWLPNAIHIKYFEPKTTKQVMREKQAWHRWREERGGIKQSVPKW